MLRAPLTVVCLLLAACNTPAPETRRETRPLMGTVVSVTALGTNNASLRAAVDAAYAEMSRLSDMMNHYNPDSVVSAINNEAGKQAVPVPPELMKVLHMAQRISERSQGGFDITVGSIRGWRFNPQNPQIAAPAAIAAQLPRVGFRGLLLNDTTGTAFLKTAGTRIDLGGIAKLPILHAGMRVLGEHGIRDAMIDGGGDIEAMGTNNGRPWRIGIRNAHHPERLFGALAVSQGVVVSSGDYERGFTRNGRHYHHILDPRTGYPTTGVNGVTLFADRMEAINGMSAAVMVLGPEKGRALIEATAGVSGIIFNADGSVWMTAGFEKRIEKLAD